MNKTIVDFLNNQTCATISCISDNAQPYSFICFYVFDAEDGLLYFKSSPATDHIKFLERNPIVFGTILPDKLNKLVVKGVQFNGIFLNVTDPLSLNADRKYYKGVPMAMAMKGNVFTIKINSIKMMDSSRVFGSKILWERDLPFSETV